LGILTNLKHHILILIRGQLQANGRSAMAGVRSCPESSAAEISGSKSVKTSAKSGARLRLGRVKLSGPGSMTTYLESTHSPPYRTVNLQSCGLLFVQLGESRPSNCLAQINTINCHPHCGYRMMDNACSMPCHTILEL
jgi:hypothetical protein